MPTVETKRVEILGDFVARVFVCVLHGIDELRHHVSRLLGVAQERPDQDVLVSNGDVKPGPLLDQQIFEVVAEKPLVSRRASGRSTSRSTNEVAHRLRRSVIARLDVEVDTRW